MSTEPSIFTAPRKIVPFLPIWARAAEGNKETRRWDEQFVDRSGNRAVVTKVEFIDKKNKLHIVDAFIKWEKM